MIRSRLTPFPGFLAEKFCRTTSSQKGDAKRQENHQSFGLVFSPVVKTIQLENASVSLDWKLKKNHGMLFQGFLREFRD